MLTFEEWPKIPRYKKELIITEKIDGTNGCVAIEHLSTPELLEHARDNLGKPKGPVAIVSGANDGDFAQALYAGSRNRWLDTSKTGDNFGFAKWVEQNAEALVDLGPGRHFGEWYGAGIQRGYDLHERRFVLFNAGRWTAETLPACCKVVPVLAQGHDVSPHQVLELLRDTGSVAVPRYPKPEGIIIFHTASRQLYKQLLENDDKPKSLV